MVDLILNLDGIQLKIILAAIFTAKIILLIIIVLLFLIWSWAMFGTIKDLYESTKE